jgi:hypothetical protein
MTRQGYALPGIMLMRTTHAAAVRIRAAAGLQRRSEARRMQPHSGRNACWGLH